MSGSHVPVVAALSLVFSSLEGIACGVVPQACAVILQRNPGLVLSLSLLAELLQGDKRICFPTLSTFSGKIGTERFS